MSKMSAAEDECLQKDRNRGKQWLVQWGSVTRHANDECGRLSRLSASSLHTCLQQVKGGSHTL